MARISLTTIALLLSAYFVAVVTSTAAGNTNDVKHVELLERLQSTPAGSVEGIHNRIRRLQHDRRLENSPTMAPSPKPKPPPNNKDTEKKKKKKSAHKNDTPSSNSGGSSQGSSSSSSSGGSSTSTTSSSVVTPSSDSSPASDSSSTPLPKKSSIMHGESKSIFTLLSSALALGFVVAGVAFVRQREYMEGENEQHPNHRLKGSVGKRMNMFIHMIDMQSTVDSSGGRLNPDDDSMSSSNNDKTRSIFRKMGKSAKKKLLRQLSKGKSVRQQSIENDIDIDVYSRAEDSHTGYDFMVV